MDLKEINSIAQKLTEADKGYYNEGLPTMSDQVYDALRATLKMNDPNHPYFEKVGEKPSSLWEKASHEIPMGSLEKVHTEEEFIKWAEKFPNEIFIIQPKLDGLSLGEKYSQGTFQQAITRGDGFIGEDISENVKKMKGFVQDPLLIYHDLHGGSAFSVRGEIILGKGDLERLNSISEEDPYKNCRNAAGGICRRLDGKFCKFLSLMYYDILTDEDPKNEDEKIDALNRVGFETVPYKVGPLQTMIDTFNKFKNTRDQLPYVIDGMVIKINSWEKQMDLGSVKNRPKGQIAWKFDPPGAATTLESVTWEVGRTGVVTPLGHVEPIEIDGSLISKVTLHNIAEIKRLNIGLGDMVMLVKAGDIIPKIIEVLDHKDSPIEIPTVCPCCGKPLLNNETQLFCENETCSAKELLRILHFIKTVKIDEFGEALAEELFVEGKLRATVDIFKLKPEDIAGVEGWGEKSAQTIIANINKARKMDPALFLSALGIPTLSTSTAEDLWKHFGVMGNIVTATVEDICTIKGYSDISAAKIVKGLKDFEFQLSNLLNFIELQDRSSGGKLVGQAFCFTGEMINSRSFYQAIVTKHGGKNESTVTKNTTYLVCNENKGSSKSKKADQYGVKIINEQAFMELVGETIAQKPKIKLKSLFEEEE